MRTADPTRPIFVAAIVFFATTTAALAGDVLRADRKPELPTADDSFAGVASPWLDPDSPLVDTGLGPILFYQVPEAASDLLARRVGDTVELRWAAVSVPCAGSGGSGGATGTQRDLTMDVLGTTRVYNRHVPADYDPDRTYPVLVFYHGLGSNHDVGAFGYQMIPLADANDFIAIFPNSLDMPDCGGVPGGKHWDVCENPPNPATSQDIVFTRQLIAEAEQLYNVCSKRIYTNGHSYGGYFSYYVAATLADEVAAFGEHSGGLLEFGPVCFPQCVPASIRKIPGALLHSTDDSVVDYSSSVTLNDRMTAAGHETWFITLTGLDHSFDTTRNQDVWDWLMARPLP